MSPFVEAKFIKSTNFITLQSKKAYLNGIEINFDNYDIELSLSVKFPSLCVYLIEVHSTFQYGTLFNNRCVTVHYKIKHSCAVPLAVIPTDSDSR